MTIGKESEISSAECRDCWELLVSLQPGEPGKTPVGALIRGVELQSSASCELDSSG